MKLCQLVNSCWHNITVVITCNVMHLFHHHKMSHFESQYICCHHTKIFSVFTILLFYILVAFVFQGLFMTQKFCTTCWCNALNVTTVLHVTILHCCCVYIFNTSVLLYATKMGISPNIMTILIKQKIN